MTAENRTNLIHQISGVKENIASIFSLYDALDVRRLQSIIEIEDELKYILQIAESISSANNYVYGRINWDFLQATEKLNDCLSRESNSVSISSKEWANGHSSNIWNAVNQFKEFAIDYLSVQSAISVQGLKIEDFRNSAINSQRESERVLTEMKINTDKASSLLNEVTSIRDGVVNSSQEYAVAKFGKDYETLSANSSKVSDRWLASIAVLSSITIGIAIYMICNLETNLQIFSAYLDKPAAIIFIIAPRLIIFSALFVGIGLSIKMYRANKHNQIINKHRQNALNTFETFIKTSGEDKGTKDAILLEVTRTIFGNQDTGFSSKESDSESTNKIIEIFKGSSS